MSTRTHRLPVARLALLVLAACDDPPDRIPGTELVLIAVADTSVPSDTPDASFDAFAGLVQNYAFGHDSRLYVRFDLRDVPAGATVLEARAELFYCGCDGIDDIGVYPAGAPWDAATLTWNNQPAPDSRMLDVIDLSGDSEDCGEVERYVGPAAGGGWLVTDLVRGWLDGTEPNHGLVFRAEPEMADPTPPGRLFAVFGNLEGGDACPRAGPPQPPRLRIRYSI